jgi:hypothetical protein
LRKGNAMCKRTSSDFESWRETGLGFAKSSQRVLGGHFSSQLVASGRMMNDEKEIEIHSARCN